MSGQQPTTHTVGGITYLELDGFSASLYRDEISGQVGVQILTEDAADEGHDHDAQPT